MCVFSKEKGDNECVHVSTMNDLDIQKALTDDTITIGKRKKLVTFSFVLNKIVNVFLDWYIFLSLSFNGKDCDK